MGIVGRSSLVLLAALVAAPAADAAKKKCTDTSGFAAVMDAVEAAAPCASATKRGKYVKAAKKAVDSRLSGACKKDFIKRFILQSTCGRRPGFVVCCSTKKGGKASGVVKAKKCAKKGGSTCLGTNPTSVGEGCTPTGACVTTTTTTSTTSAPTTTTTVAPPPPDMVLDFVLSKSADSCGKIEDGSGGLVRALVCGGLNIGGGTSTVSEGPTPDGSTSRFGLDCTGSACTIGPTTANPGLNDPGPDCSTTGCNFGTPLPIPNLSQPALSTCVLNTWDRPASGTLDTSTGMATLSVPLNSDVYLTSNAVQACPKCSATGTPESPGRGTCDRGPRQGQTCVTTSSTGLTRDCPTGGSDATRPCTPGGGNCIDGSHVGPIKVDLTPLTTGSATQTAAADGTFCPEQGGPGCFGSKECRAITETGSPGGPVTPGTPANVTLASVFCIAKTGNGIVDGAANLPGPGAVSLPGQVVIKNPGATTTLAPVTTTTSTPTSTTTSTTNPCGNGTKDPGEQCDSGSSTGAFVGGECGFCTTTCTCIACPPEDITHKTFKFTNSQPAGLCGDAKDDQMAVVKELKCGGLNIGGGTSATPEGPTPDGAVNKFSMTCCEPTGQCTLAPTSDLPPLNSGEPDCTTTGCNFGTPLPVPNPVAPAISTCVLNTLLEPASGNVVLKTGMSTTSIVLKSDIYQTGNVDQPCPRCSATGTPESPGTGTCDRGPRATQTCVTTSQTGLTRDCPTGGADATNPCTEGGGICIDGSHVAPITVNLTPLTTAPVTASSGAAGTFCGSTNAGCFGKATCRSITENGVPAGAITEGTPANATLASVFCIAATGNGLIDAVASLPGPGAVSLPGTFRVDPVQ